MKNVYVLISLFLLGFCGCEEDETLFGVSIPKENVSFTPVSGGAVMHYRLPNDSDVLSICARYKNAQGKEEMRSGSYACDSLVLSGFDEAAENIPVSVTLYDRAGNESAPEQFTFSTKDSGPILLLDNVKVSPKWAGFEVSYDIPEAASGMAHVFYVGENPQTHEPDTLLLESFFFDGGADTLTFKLQQEQSENTVVIRTENIEGGYIAGEKVIEGIKAYNMELMFPDLYDFLDPEELTIEDETSMLSKKYLFDGDTKGFTCFGIQDSKVFGTYLAGPYAFGKPLFILDLKEAKHLAEVRLYTVLHLKRSFAGIFKNFYEEKLPNDVTIYGSNNKDDEASWVELGHFQQDRGLDPSLRWCAKCAGPYWWYIGSGALTKKEQIEAADPYYMSIQFPIESGEYRYLKVVVNETFDACAGYRGTNMEQRVTFHEFEVYTKKIRL